MSTVGKPLPDPRSAADDSQRPAQARRPAAWRRDAYRRRLLAGADGLAAVAVTLTFGATAGAGPTFVVFLLAIAVVAIVAAKFLGQYDRDHRLLSHATGDELQGVVTWTALVTVWLVVVLRSVGDPLPSGMTLVAIAVTMAGMDLALRAGARQLWRQSTAPERIVIVGSGALEHTVRRKLQIFDDLHLELVASFPESAAGLDLGTFERLGDGVDRILIAATSVDEQLIAELIRHCRRNEIKLGLIPPARGMFGTAVVLDHLADMPIVQYNTWDVSRSTELGKRVFDVVVAAGALLVTLPLQALIALCIRLDSPGPVLFRQQRAGKGGRPFEILKFRTMCGDAEQRLCDVVDIKALPEPVFKLRDDPRVTRVGRALRRLSLDELPQLVNILRGDMSLVGPRPEQLDLVERYPIEARVVRLAVRPGLTGPMQVFGRGALAFEERLAVEREYVENLSLARDVRILGRTLSAVFRGRGAY
jgi:exopolysaccharide biosynthesis polyprenyl glycosylphosphotransferase